MKAQKITRALNANGACVMQVYINLIEGFFYERKYFIFQIVGVIIDFSVTFGASKTTW